MKGIHSHNLKRFMAMLLCVCVLLSCAGFGLRDEEQDHDHDTVEVSGEEDVPAEPVVDAEETPADTTEESVVQTPEVAEEPETPEVTQEPDDPAPETTDAPADTETTVEPAEESAPAEEPVSDVEGDTPALTEEPEAEESEEIMPLALLGGQVVENAATAKVKVWDLYGASKEVRDAYDALYRIDEKPTVSINRGSYGSTRPEYILDDNEQTFWEPNYGDSATNHTLLTFTFSEVQTIGRLVYGSRLDAGYKGFPYEFAIYGSMTDNQDDFVLVAQGSYGAAVGSLIEITFPQTQFKRLRFEYVTSKESYPSCREMMFYGEDNSNERIEKVFTDYAHFELAEFCNTQEKLDVLREELKGNPKYDSTYKAVLDRAQKILDGEIKYQPDLYELSTAPGSKNLINRTGDVTSYGRGTYSGGLRFTSSSTNRQATGIAAYAGATITIYVDAPEGDPLPKIRFSQAYGYWSSWLSGELELVRGVNTFTVPDFWNSAYTHACAHGGAIYIVNPYVPEELPYANQRTQSAKVKLYIEGGDRYPIYHLGDDEAAYKAELNEYAARVKADPTGVTDLTELVSDHVIMTVTATRASEIYDYASPQRNLDKWNEIIKESLIFEGVTFDTSNPHYYYMNEFLNVNYRVSQNWPNGFMFAAGEHIGLYEKGNGEDTLIYCLNERGKPSVGWGHIHEYGHTIDLASRVIGETTNNMVANFLNTYFNDLIRNEDYITAANNMTSERTYVNTSKYGTTFNSNRYNYMIYFLVESYQPGWWGASNNIYRYSDEWPDYNFNAMNQTERHVFISSLALGVDLGYYFERWGYQLNTSSDPVFTVEGASQAYKNQVATALANGDLETNELPIWYMDSAQYMFMRNDNDPALYDENDTTSIVRVLKTANGYSLTLPVVDDDAHLGYEVWEGEGDAAQIIGFTHSNGFTDTTAYQDGYEPVYQVVAYDRRLGHTAKSDPTGISTAETGVAELNGKVYDSIAAAVTAAGHGDTIYLLKDAVETGVTLTGKTVTIVTKDAEERIIKKAGTDPIFTVGQNGKLIINSGTGHGAITIDGERYARTTALIELTGNGQLEMTGVVMEDAISSGDGGAIKVSSASVRGTFNQVTFKNNTAANGGAIYNVGTITLNNCTITGNKATTNGGGLCNTNGGVMTVNNSTVTGNTAVNGGGYYINGNTAVNGGAVTGNTAKNGGAVYAVPANWARGLTMTGGVIVDGNDADFGGFLHMTTTNATTVIAKAVIGDNTGARAEASGNSEGGLRCDIYAAPGSVEIDGSAVTFSTDQVEIYKSGGVFTVKKAMPKVNFIFTLGTYSTADPVVTTDFVVESMDNVSVMKANGGTHDLKTGDNGKNIYLYSSSSVTLNTNGGTIRSGNVTSYVEGVRTVLPTDIVRAGYTFLGWYKDADFKDGPYQSIAADEVGDKVYWANWSVTRYTITYRYDGGTMSGDYPTSYTANEDVVLPTAANVTRSGTTFEGWYDNSNFNGSAITSIPAGSTGNKTFYANWECKGKDPVREHEEAASCTEGGSYELVVYCMYCGKVMSRDRFETDPLKHTFGDWSELPGGVSKRVCSVCGFEETKIDESQQHVWDDDFTVDVQPTCETDGSQSVHCSHCDATKDAQVLTKLGHDPSEAYMMNEVRATCENGGSYDMVIICKRCGVTLSSQSFVTDALGHKFGEWETITGSTCDTEGSQKRVCSVCGYTENRNIVEEGHDWEDVPTVDVAPTCTSDGSQSIHCRKCGTTKNSTVIPTLDHVPGTPQVEFESAATCEADGTRILVTYCSACLTQLNRETVTIPATGHEWSDWEEVESPDCDDSGVLRQVCGKCGKTQTQNVNPSGHTWDINFTVDKEPTCTEAGSRSIHCAKCDAVTEVQTIPALGHQAMEPVRENINPAGCETDGSYNEVTYCQRCAAVISRVPVTVPAFGHDFSDWKVIASPDCDDEGTEIRTCSRCNLTETKNLTPLGHNWMEGYIVDQAPTCTTDGSQSIHCLNCSAVKDSMVLPATGHVAGEPVRTVIIPATCTQNGLYDEEIYCAVCGELMMRTTGATEPAGHIFGQPDMFRSCDGVERTRLVCTVCGYTESEGDADDFHRWAEDYTVDVEPGCETDGSQSIHCLNDGCEAVKNAESIPAAGHTLELTGVKEATCTEEGYTGDTVCSVCGKVLREGEVIPMVAHEYQNGKCVNCGQADPDYEDDKPTATPTPKPEVTPTPAPEQTDTPAATPTPEPTPGSDDQPDDSGDISHSAQSGENAPAAEISMDTAALAEAILTDDEKKQVEAGANVDVLLTVEDATDVVSDEDKAMAEAAAGTDYVIGQYLDLSLVKIISDNEGSVKKTVLKTNKPIVITLDIPEAMRADNRTFAVIRIHGDDVSILPDLDSDANTITFQTDRFSVYAIAYRDMNKAPDAPTSSPAAGNSNSGPVAPNTGDESPLWSMLAVMVADLMLAITVLSWWRKKKKT